VPSPSYVTDRPDDSRFCDPVNPSVPLLPDLPIFLNRDPTKALDSFYVSLASVEVSKDRASWIEINYHNNDSGLKGSRLTAMFAVRKICQSRMIRLSNFGENWGEGDALIISAFETFGNVIQ